MAAMQRVIEQVAGILHRNEVPFVTRADGNGYRIMRESSATFISFAQFGETVMVSVHSPVLQEIEENGQLLEILTAVNDLNASTAVFAVRVLPRGAGDRGRVRPGRRRPSGE